MMDTLLSQINPVAYLFLVIIGFFIVRTLRQIDRNQTELWHHMDDLSNRLAKIEGEHNVFTSKGGHKP